MDPIEDISVYVDEEICQTAANNYAIHDANYKDKFTFIYKKLASLVAVHFPNIFDSCENMKVSLKLPGIRVSTPSANYDFPTLLREIFSQQNEATSAIIEIYLK